MESQRAKDHSLVRHVLASPEDKGQLLSLRDNRAVEVMECMLQLLKVQGPSPGVNQRHGRGKILRLLVELSKAANVLPPSLFVGDVICVNREVVACGGYADIFRAERNGIAVALKKLRVTQRWETVKSSTFFRETLYWQCLKHEHILPFLGVDCITFVPYSCMVSPWMKYGNINQCMDTLESMNQELPLKLWMYQIGLGLQYLHSENVVHGDLRGANILIDDELSVKLCDFGLAHFVDTSSASPGSYTGGACRWMSPSILRGGRPNYSSDIYAFGCVWLETHTRRAPFSNLSEHHMISKVLEGTRPDFSGADLLNPNALPGLHNLGIWNFIWSCLSSEPEEQPSTEALAKTILSFGETSWIRKKHAPPVSPDLTFSALHPSPPSQAWPQHRGADDILTSERLLMDLADAVGDAVYTRLSSAASSPFSMISAPSSSPFSFISSPISESPMASSPSAAAMTFNPVQSDMSTSFDPPELHHWGTSIHAYQRGPGLGRTSTRKAKRGSMRNQLLDAAVHVDSNGVLASSSI